MCFNCCPISGRLSISGRIGSSLLFPDPSSEFRSLRRFFIGKGGRQSPRIPQASAHSITAGPGAPIGEAKRCDPRRLGSRFLRPLKRLPAAACNPGVSGSPRTHPSRRHRNERLPCSETLYRLRRSPQPGALLPRSSNLSPRERCVSRANCTGSRQPSHVFLIRATLAPCAKAVKKHRCQITLSAQSELCERVFPGTPIQTDLPCSRGLHS